MPTMPVGTEFFNDLVSGQYYFVDKTASIREFYDNKSKVTLITRPRRFGKTLFLQMLKEFFSVENAGKKNLFNGLEISRDVGFCDIHQNKYPVIFFTLKEIKEKTFAEAREEFSKIIADLAYKYSHILQLENLKVEQRKWLERISGVERTDLSWKAMSTSIRTLCNVLEDYYGVKPIVLLDEYDTPIQIAWQKGYYDDMIGFMKVFLGNILKTNPALNFAVLTGVLRISKESIFSDLNNLNVLTVTSDKLNKIMGFTEEEVLDLASQVNAEGKMPEIKKWYNGYRFGDADIYNPFSVVTYLYNNCKPEAYWVNTSSNGILKEMLRKSSGERVEKLQGLLKGKAIRSVIDDKVIYTDIYKSDTALYTMLLTTGYLKCRYSGMALNRLMYDMEIPNLEVYQCYQTDILNYVTKDYDYSCLAELLDAIKVGDAAAIEKHIGNVLVNVASVYDLAGASENRESFYHGLMLGMTALVNQDYVMESNRESGYGRFDIALFPKRADAAGVVMEFKSRNMLKRWAGYDKFRMDKALAPTCKRALEQIESKEYVTEFTKRGVAKVTRLGIAFCGKYVAVRAK